MPRNVWLLMLAQALNQSSAPLVVLVGGLIGSQLAPSPQWVTLPIALMVVGQTTWHASILAARYLRAADIATYIVIIGSVRLSGQSVSLATRLNLLPENYYASYFAGKNRQGWLAR